MILLTIFVANFTTMQILEKIFKLKSNGTNIHKEAIAGLTTFMTMAYILSINPSILSSTGMDSGALFTATALSSFVACVLMGLLANLPIALAPGLGLNAFFAYTIVSQMGYSWQMALAAVFVGGLIFILLSIFNIRDLLIRSIPLVLKHAISVGIGLFITTIGLVNSGVIEHGGAFIQLGDISSAPILLTFISVIIIGALMVREVKGALILGMLITTIIAIPMGVVTIPEGFSLISLPSSIEPIFFKMDFSQILSIDMFVVIFILIFTDLFDTAGALFAICSKTGMVDEKGNVSRAKEAFLSDSLATTFGAILGTSSVTSYVESVSGVAAGGRTGLTSVFTGVMFLCALIFMPLFALIPVAATSAVLIIVGLFMIASINQIDFTDYKDSLPAFITIIFIPFTYSVSEGILYGFLSYVIIRLLVGRYRDISMVMYLLSIIFIVKLILV